MDKIYVVYWSQSGNTQAMAEAIGKGIADAGKEAAVLYVGEASLDELKKAKGFALGCPAMGAEVLEEMEMEPFVSEVENFAAGMKSGSLFNCRFTSKTAMQKEITDVNQKLNKRGVYVEAMLWKEGFVLIYAYRRTHLARELQKDGVMELLASYGYTSRDVDECMIHLKSRLFHCDGFPHEIGVFLGYPIEDVKGFIENKGRECKFCGLWKVYCNECETRKLFEKIQKCTRVYLQVFAEGRSISQMTVSA